MSDIVIPISYARGEAPGVALTHLSLYKGSAVEAKPVRPWLSLKSLNWHLNYIFSLYKFSWVSLHWLKSNSWQASSFLRADCQAWCSVLAPTEPCSPLWQGSSSAPAMPLTERVRRVAWAFLRSWQVACPSHRPVFAGYAGLPMGWACSEAERAAGLWGICVGEGEVIGGCSSQSPQDLGGLGTLLSFPGAPSLHLCTKRRCVFMQSVLKASVVL